MDLLCIGFGFVGKAYAILLRENGHEVKVITKEDETKTDSEKYGFTQPIKNEIFDVAIIAVPTPSNENGFNSEIIEQAINTAITKHSCKNIIIKSTVLPGTTQKFSENYPNTEFYFYPEFLEAKNPIGGVFNQKIKVFGTNNWTEEKKRFINELFKLNEIEFTNFETAETIKYAHNLWLTCNISFWNSMLKTKNEKVDFEIVLNEVHKSDYFGKHPWVIGKPFGGDCLPKDLKAYIHLIKSDSIHKKFIENIERVNNQIT